MAPASKESSSLVSQWTDLLHALHGKYDEQTPRKLKLIDAFIVFSIFLAVLQFAYGFASDRFPYNSFLAGTFCALGYAILCLCLRLQVANPADFGNITAESAFAGFLVGSLVLFTVVSTFMG